MITKNSIQTYLENSFSLGLRHFRHVSKCLRPNDSEFFKFIWIEFFMSVLFLHSRADATARKLAQPVFFRILSSQYFLGHWPVFFFRLYLSKLVTIIIIFISSLKRDFFAGFFKGAIFRLRHIKIWFVAEFLSPVLRWQKAD